MDEESQQSHGSFSSYWRVLRDHKAFRLLWIAETADNLGAWLNYVATLVLVQEFSGGSGLALSGVVLIRFLPSLLLSPLSGVLADRVNRLKILMSMALMGGLAAAALALVRDQSQLPLLYFLLFVQFCAISFYDPARKAMLPVVVPPQDLGVATTIDSFAWSLTGAVGASVGGAVASKVGYSACFLMDAATYIFAAGCAAMVPAELGQPDAGPGAASKQLNKTRSSFGTAADPGSLELAEAAGPDVVCSIGVAPSASWPPGGQGLNSRQHSEEVAGSHTPVSRLGGSRHNSPDKAVFMNGESQARSHAGKHKQSDSVEAVLGQEEGTRVAAGTAQGGRPSQALHSSGSNSGGLAGVLAAAAAAWKEGVLAFWEGWTYIRSRENRDVAVVVTIKGSAALVWGAVEIANVRFADMSSMQWLGDTETTLGFIFGTVGLGCFIGPIVMNLLIKPQPTPLLWGVVAAFWFLFVGYLVLLVAPNIVLFLLASFIRATGSATLWIYSSLLLQMRVPNNILGRMSAVEGALYTVSEAASSVFAGLVLDMHLSLFGLCLILTVLQAAITLSWSVYAQRTAAAGQRPAYQAVSTAVA